MSDKLQGPHTINAANVGSTRDLIMLVSRNVFHVVSALQFILFLHIFTLADQISCRSYIGSVYRMRSLAVCHSFMNFWTVGLYRSDTLCF